MTSILPVAGPASYSRCLLSVGLDSLMCPRVSSAELISSGSRRRASAAQCACWDHPAGGLRPSSRDPARDHGSTANRSEIGVRRRAARLGALRRFPAIGSPQRHVQPPLHERHVARQGFPASSRSRSRCARSTATTERQESAESDPSQCDRRSTPPRHPPWQRWASGSATSRPRPGSAARRVQDDR
jgi:hypothetical protein